jgi:ATP-binding cassette subfamily B protein
MMALTSLQLTGLILLATPLAILHLWLLASRLQRVSRASQDRVADLGAYGDEVLHAIRTVQAFCHEPVDRARYCERVETAFRTATRRARVGASVAAFPTALTYGIIGVVLWFGGHEVLAGRMTGGQLSAFLYYALLLGSSAGGLYAIASELIRGAGASERLMELLTAESQIRPPAHPQPLPAGGRGRIEFNRLRFAYPSHPDSAVLKDLSLTIEPGSKVALVGPSGAGKSTLFQLLLRFYDPQQGSIHFDGIDLRDLDPRDLRRQIAVVPQDPVIFGADAWENIRYGFESVTEADVRRAADAAHATDFLDRLPEGFNTFLGERGVRLSGGQRQRIAIARAILRNPPLLLLDEATSALDAESERLVQLALEELMTNRTSIVIAHRLATVRKVDRILVFDQGRLVAQGTHEELMNQGGLYARLAALQFRGKEPFDGGPS